MRTIRAHSRTVALLSFAVALAVAGVAWWLLASGAPTNAQVIADACTHFEEVESGAATKDPAKRPTFLCTIQIPGPRHRKPNARNAVKRSTKQRKAITLEEAKHKRTANSLVT